MTVSALRAKPLPNYTKTEELMNTISHSIGIAMGLFVLVICILESNNTIDIIGSTVYGLSMVFLYSISSIYHGTKPVNVLKKQILRIIDHCTIFVFIAGSYTPIVLNVIYRSNHMAGILMLSIIWITVIVGITLNAIDLDRYSKFSMSCYLILGWCAIFIIKPIIIMLGLNGTLLLIAGGISYSIGAILYGIGKKHRYMHFVFHIFVLLGTLLQYFCILNYVINNI